MHKKQPHLPFEFHGCERGIVCDVSAACFTPHPWSPTGETCLFSSAYMRARHAAYEIERLMRHDGSYYEAIEIQLKASLLNHPHKSKRE